MADKVKDAANGFDADTFKGVIKAINREKEKASEHVGRAGQATKDAIERHNYNRKGLTFIAGLSKKETAEQAEVMSAILVYGHAMGMFDSTDMFDPSVTVMKKIIEDVDAGRSGRPAADSAVSQMVSTQAH